MSEKELVVFTRQFATMIDAGLPLVQCLEILSGQGDNKQFRKIQKEIKNYVEQGGTFSEGLRKHPKVFDDLYVNLVAAGEMGGILDTILQRLSVYIEKRVKLKRQVKGAMVYPTAVLCVAIAVIVVMLTWVIPALPGNVRGVRRRGQSAGPHEGGHRHVPSGSSATSIGSSSRPS